MIELSSYRNYKEATFLISVIGEPNRNNVVIEKETAELYMGTLKDMPCVAYLKSTEDDLGGHEYKYKINQNGEKEYYFATNAIGTYIDVWIEEREIDGFDDKKEVILAKSKIWSTRFPKYMKVVDDLFEEGKLSSSWEIDVIESEITGANKVLKEWEFIGNCLLGSNVTPAVPQAGILEVASISDDEMLLAEALAEDVFQNKQDKVEASFNNEVEINKEDNINNQGGEDMSEIVKNKGKEMSSVTINDLYQKVSDSINFSDKDNYWYIARVYPYEFRAVAYTWWRESEDDYVEFTFSTSSDETVQITGRKDVKMAFVPTETIDTQLAEKDTQIAEITEKLTEKDTELSTKLDEVIKLGAEIQAKDTTIAELTPYKEKVETSEAEKKEAEIAQKKEELKAYATKGGFITDEEIETSEEIKTAISELNVTFIKGMIADRVVASLDKETKSEIEASSVETQNTKVDLNANNVEIDPLMAFKDFLK